MEKELENEITGAAKPNAESSGDRSLEDRFKAVEQRIRDAEKDAGRAQGSVMLLPAVKYADSGQIRTLYERCGLRDIGENRVQTLKEHTGELSDLDGLRVHVIGSLQANKAKYVAGRVTLIHSLDSLKLAGELDRLCEKRGAVQDVLVEINSGHEESKGGVEPEQAAEFCAALAGYGHISVKGFMTMGPAGAAPDEYYNIFSKTYNLSLDIWTKILHNIKEPIFSMGMTDSLEPAVAAGATCVRIGRAIFGGNPAANKK